MKEQGRHHLEQAISQMKTHEAPDIWNELSTELDRLEESGKENLDDAITKMGTLEAPDVWSAIEKELDSPEVSIERASETSTPRQWWAVAAAAALLVVSISYFLRNPGDGVDEHLAYSTEVIQVFNVSQELKGFDTGNDEVLGFIQKNCNSLVAQCQNPEFKGLLDTYLELNKAKQDLELQIENTSNKEQLIKYLIRVEKNKTDVGKDMLKMLKYS